MDFIHLRALMSELLTLTYFTREFDFMTMFIGARSLTLRVMRILVLLYILIAFLTTRLLVVI